MRTSNGSRAVGVMLTVSAGQDNHVDEVRPGGCCQLHMLLLAGTNVSDANGVGVYFAVPASPLAPSIHTCYAGFTIDK